MDQQARRQYKSIDVNIRELICKGYDDGELITELSDCYKVNYQTVRSIIRKYKRTGRVNKSPKKNNRQPKLSPRKIMKVRRLIDQDCTTTLKAIQEKLSQENIRVSLRTIGRAVRTFYYRFKRTSLIPEKRNDPTRIDERYFYSRQFAQLDEDKLYFLDETGYQFTMRRRYGWSNRGSRANKTVSQIRSKNISVSAVMSKSSLFYFEILDKPYNRDDYAEFIEKLLDQFDQLSISDAVLVRDNVPFHRNSSIKALIETRGHHLIYLPAYSPFLNPIEEVFSKWKHLVRTKNCVSEDDLFDQIHLCSEQISEADCRGYFNHMKKYLLRCLDRQEILD